MGIPEVDAILETFVTKLLEEKQLQNVDDEVLAQLKADLRERIEDRLDAVIVSHVPVESLATFEELLHQDNAENLQSFCTQHIPNLQELLASELLAFRKTYIGLPTEL